MGNADMGWRNVTIIGAGASGLMAAICAARCGADVTVLEHMSEAGIKLSLTGNGRCNYTNTDVSGRRNAFWDDADPDVSGRSAGDRAGGAADVRHYHSLGEFADKAYFKTFVGEILNTFDYERCIGFFKELGIEPAVRHYDFDDYGYVYPLDMDARGFRDVLVDEAKRIGVKFRYKVSSEELKSVFEELIDIGESKAGSEKKAAARMRDNKNVLILACGSNAYPATGSDSSIYPFIKRLGLKFNTFLPALCALYSKDEQLRSYKGKRVRGTVTLDIYPGTSQALLEQSKPEQNKSEHYECYGEIQFNEHSISGIPVMQLSGYAAEALKMGKRAVLTADGHEFEIHRTAGFDKSQVCRGGIDISEINPYSMGCLRAPGVYVCGELLDVDGDCGGFNLHFAWATGFIAGIHAAMRGW
ncbi:MAG: NAD(P)/FAD-dependent oxidoreductase [Eubacteriales bacterium]|nr:NAD(P)/FAD-dependent oxidoreductase [Eubacteriales bacterium]